VSITELVAENIAGAAADLQIRPDTGLTAPEVAATPGACGPLTTAKHRKSLPLLCVATFSSVSGWMLDRVSAVSWWWLGRYINLDVAAWLLVVNAIVSFVQERRTKSVVATPRSESRSRARSSIR
jgi:hypothetical protein